MPVAWHTNRCLNFCVSEDEKKEPNFHWGVVKVCVGSIQYGGIRTFWDRKLYINFLAWFWYKYTKICAGKYLKQVGTCYNSKYL